MGVAESVMAVSRLYIWDSNQQRDLGKPSQAIDGKLLNVLSHVVSEKTHSALRKEQGWIHSLQCCQHWATQVCMKQNVN
jgi:hypothetical protein